MFGGVCRSAPKLPRSCSTICIAPYGWWCRPVQVTRLLEAGDRKDRVSNLICYAICATSLLLHPPQIPLPPLAMVVATIMWRSVRWGEASRRCEAVGEPALRAAEVLPSSNSGFPPFGNRAVIAFGLVPDADDTERASVRIFLCDVPENASKVPLPDFASPRLAWQKADLKCPVSCPRTCGM